MRKSLVIFLLSVSLGWAVSLLAAPSAQLVSDFWLQNNPQSVKTIDNTAWAEFLKKYVSTNKEGVNVIDYGKVTGADKIKLNKYIKQLEHTKITDYNRCVQLAYWINLYNAATVKLVLDHYPVESIRDIRKGLLGSGGPWQEKLLVVEGKRLSLNDIEHGILRPIYKSPLIHYAVNCASFSCPNLAKKPYSCEEGAAMLEQAAKDYVNSPRGVGIAPTGLKVSRIYDWYQSDFGDSKAGVLQHIQKYLSPEKKQKVGDKQVESYQYNWKLNAA